MTSKPPLIPLQHAFCEVRFPGDPEIDAVRGAFYRSVRDDFPAIQVPRVEQGQAIAIEPYRFVSPDESRFIGVAMNSFSYGVTGDTYRSFEAFKNDFQSYLAKFQKVYSYLEGFTRIGLRYINYLPVKRGSMDEIEFMPLTLHMALDGKTRNTLRVTEYERSNGVIRVVVDTTNQEIGPNQALLDFDFAYNASVNDLMLVSELDSRIKEAHVVVKDSLRSFLDEEYAQEVGITWP